MATILSTLYPPLIGTFQPAFEYDDGPEITFTISNYNSYSSIKHLHISLVNQKTNQNAFALNKNNAYEVPDGTYLINGIWIVPFKDDNSKTIFTHFSNEDNLYKIKIPNTILKNKSKEFVIDYYYKVQLRFDCVTDNMISSDSQNTFDYNYLNRYRSYFSEWSSISLLKAVPHVEIQLTNFSIINSNGLSNSNLKSVKVPQFSPGVIPITGKLIYSKNNNNVNIADSGKEWIKDYQIKIYKKEDDESNTLILDSDIIYPDAYKFTQNSLNIDSKSQDYWTNNFSYLADLTDEDFDSDYILNIIIHTKNNYTAEKSFNFKLTSSLFTPNWIWSFETKQLSYYGTTIEKIVTEEDGEINGEVRIEPDLDSQSTNYLYQREPGYMFIRRSDSLSNFKNWTIIKCVSCANPLTPVKFTDKTVGSLIRYRYSAQYLCFRGGVQTPVNKCSTIIYPDFHDILLSSGDKQLAIRYNGQINSMTPIVNRTKIDTLGGRYPKFAENAKLNYKQFNLSGLLIAESDYNRKFLNDLDYLDDMSIYDDTQHGTYMVRNDTVIENFDSEHLNGTYTDTTNDQKLSSQKNTNHDIYPTNNWWWERKFREEAMKWLNNGEPKLYRSMTEGNMVVMLDGISLTPNNQLGRRVWNFSCTVYEIEDGYNLETLDLLNIFHIENEYEEKSIDFNAIYDDDDEDSLIRKTITTLGQQYEVSSNNSNNILNVVNDNIAPEINRLYQGIGKNYRYKFGSALLHNLKIHFTSPPRYFDLNSENIDLLETLEESFFGSNSSLGYRLELSYYDGEKSSIPVSIFVPSLDGRTGYYQVPSNLIISEVTLYDNAVATLDYNLTYKIDYYNTSIADFYSQEETLVGQVSDYWSFGTNINDYINEKYRVYNYVPTTEENDYEYAEGLIYWNGINIESDPYSIYEITYKEGITNVVSTSERNKYIIPRTGTLNLSKDYKISSCWASGKQMVVVNNERTSYLDEWECVLDDSVTNIYTPGETVSDGEYWYLVRGSNDIILDTDSNNNYVLVKIRISNNNVVIIDNDENAERILSWDDFNNGVLDIYEDWFNLDEIKNCIIANIKQPDYNKVYRIIDNNLVAYNMIYYLNQGWYPIDFIDNEDQSVMWAKVPISGMIEYRADIYKQGWEVLDKDHRSSNLQGNTISIPQTDNVDS